ncbi:peptide-methionine (S)-S-oxide reductase MsrA [Moraxella equi]|uniref:Peptide methionine sulfoxide reductase MsrA n=1 Tax=Moraxella equi TaxID=60442 RepID=A0A378QRA3_9GAMM|nr:peptide-methionine (S)-S-oxide reductase MsrA [Moraxella equi]OPH39136.1 peptide-methionine (S)-S-oxide reductase [Moraxella equi]STZ03429.1 Peptide methionine sulfoxide reductase MsrA [Moraxella equi]
MQEIILGGGCFWCTESVFLAVKGVDSVTSGYAGGQAETADYESVCSGQTGHVEVIKVVYDEQVIDLSSILDIFFAMHDPTTLNRQGNDIGTQYASVIFYTDEADLPIINDKIAMLKADGINVVTRVEKAPAFYQAEDYHQNFFAKNPTQGYCNFAIPPKLQKLKAGFGEFLK